MHHDGAGFYFSGCFAHRDPGDAFDCLGSKSAEFLKAVGGTPAPNGPLRGASQGLLRGRQPPRAARRPACPRSGPWSWLWCVAGPLLLEALIAGRPAPPSVGSRFFIGLPNLQIVYPSTSRKTKKADVAEHPRCSTTSAYSSTSPPARPGCSSSSHPTTSLAKPRSSAPRLFHTLILRRRAGNTIGLFPFFHVWYYLSGSPGKSDGSCSVNE